MKSGKGPHAHLTAAMLGAVAVSGQIILMREIMVLFYGNELSAGVCLLSWLWWTAAGSLVGTLIARRRFVTVESTARLMIVFYLLLPATVVICRIAKTLIGLTQGEIVGVGLISVIAGTTLFPFCFVSGSLFALIIASARSGRDDAETPSRIYLFESVGSAAFGVITALVLIRYWDALTIAFIISAAAVGITAVLSFIGERRITAAALSLLTLLLFLGPVVPFPDIGMITRNIQWHGFEVVESADTVYGNITVTRAESQVSFYDNGVLAFSYPDLMSTEQDVIYPLLMHPSPSRVLLMGGGVSSTLSQILKHPSVTGIDYVELDPALIDMALQYLPPEATGPLSDGRVHVFHTDGRLFVKETNAHYDVIIVNMSDPLNARINRYFTREFFDEARRILDPGGVFCISVGSSAEIISPVLASFLSGVSLTLSSAFPHTAVVPGERAYFIASDRPDRISLDPSLLATRMKERSITNTYVTEHYLAYALSPERVEYVRQSMRNADSIGINTDLAPTVYYYDMVLRSYGLSPGIKIAVTGLSRIRPSVPLAALAFITLLYVALCVVYAARKRMRPGMVIFPAAFTSGFSEIALTVVLIIAFQTFYGYVYFNLGMIVSAFMVGLVLGTLTARIWIKRISRPLRDLGAIQLFYASFCLNVLAVLFLFSDFESAVTFKGLDLVFSSLNMLCGMLCALHYVIAVKILTDSGAPPESGGWVYGINLLGAAAGACTASVVMIPIWGLVTTVLLVCAANVCALSSLIGLTTWAKG